jgi:carboxylesterase
MTNSSQAIGYSQFKENLLASTTNQENSLSLNKKAKSRFLLHPHKTKRVCLFFHGFTSGPMQFLPMAESFFQDGYNVLIPLMPGHGFAGDWQEKNPPPLPTDPKVYQDFALDWLAQAQQLGDEVVIGGLSGGGTVAAWLALEKPTEVYRSLLFAPYLSSSSKIVDLFVKKFSLYFQWQIEPGYPDFGGYPGFQIEALRTFLNLGDAILAKAKKQPSAPTFMICSESDMAVGNMDNKRLFEEIVKQQPITWYVMFDRVLDVPHSMMTKGEGNQYQNLLITMTKAFVGSSLTWQEVEEIAYRMTQGKTYPQVIQELNLTNKVAPEMAAMMTMVDKRAIAQKRNPSIS